MLSISMNDCPYAAQLVTEPDMHWTLETCRSAFLPVYVIACKLGDKWNTRSPTLFLFIFPQCLSVCEYPWGHAHFNRHNLLAMGPMIGLGPYEGSPPVLTPGLLLVSTTISWFEYGTDHVHTCECLPQKSAFLANVLFSCIQWEICSWLCIFLCYLGPQIWAACLTKAPVERVPLVPVCSSLFHRVTLDLWVYMWGQIAHSPLHLSMTVFFFAFFLFF